MKLNSILSVFAPNESKFFPLLEESAAICARSGALMAELFSTPEREKIPELYKAIKAEESKGDKITSIIFTELNNTFITPFDREDISELTDVIDDAVDAMNRAAHKVVLFQPETLPESTRLLAEILQKGTAEINSAVRELSNLKKNDKDIRRHIKEIKRLEEEADVVYEKGTTDLFRSDIKAVELIKLKEIIQELEKSANRINNVGKCLKTVIVKYS
jgi:predicted phosphate transport protein (TIGR00153 family)